MIPQQENIVNCPACGQPMDVSQLPPYANAICPGCQALTRVKTRMGPYRITGKLGKGGMSVVFRAEDAVLGREVALKVLNDTYAGDALRCERFEREARIMARVSHENLVQLYAVGRDQGLFYIAMELVEGNGLDALIAAEERVPEDRVLRLTLDIVRGLDAAWNAGLMHRDIKPANVLLSPDGAAKIVDFGLSLLHSESDMEREIWVTPYYAAPETLLRGEEDFRTDMYALGATMYHLLAGAPPRVDASQSSDILLENKKNLPRLEQVVNDVSPMTCFIVDRLMAFDREDRFSSYPELMDAVAQAQEEYARAMQESGLTWAERRAVEARRARRRKCRIIVASSIASVVALALGVWGWTKWREEGAPAPATPPSPISPAAEAALEDRGAAESRLERSIRFGKLFNEAQESLNRGDLVKAAAMFGDLAAQPDCPLSTSLWAGLNQVLCMWVRGQFPEGVERLEELGRDSRYDGAFWEETLYRKDRMIVTARVVHAADAVEINTYEQLREIDSDSSQLQTDAIQVICEALGAQQDEVTNITVLKKGMTNRSFLFSCKDKKYIMRIPGEGTDQLINRRQEAAVYQTIAGRRICDEIAYINPENGYKITEYLEGARVCDAEKEEDLQKCMKKLREFHGQKLRVDHSFDLFGQMEYYESLWEGTPSAYKDYEKTKAHVLQLKDYIEANAGERVLTHIDAVPDNFLFVEENGKEEIRLIDWEYAGMQDPHVDIAMFCIYSLYKKEQVDHLIDLYFEGSCDDKTRIKIYCYIAVCGLLWSNWCEYKRKLGVEFGEYSLRQYRYAKDYYKIVQQELGEEGKEICTK